MAPVFLSRQSLNQSVVEQVSDECDITPLKFHLVMDKDVQNELIKTEELIIDQITRAACMIAKKRKSSNIDTNDVLRALQLSEKMSVGDSAPVLQTYQKPIESPGMYGQFCDHQSFLKLTT